MEIFAVETRTNALGTSAEQVDNESYLPDVRYMLGVNETNFTDDDLRFFVEHARWFVGGRLDDVCRARRASRRVPIRMAVVHVACALLSLRATHSPLPQNAVELHWQVAETLLWDVSSKRPEPIAESVAWRVVAETLEKHNPNIYVEVLEALTEAHAAEALKAGRS